MQEYESGFELGQQAGVLRDRTLNNAAIATAVNVGALFVLGLVSVAVFFPHFWNTGSPVYYDATAAKTLYSLALLVNLVDEGCPQAPADNCSEATAANVAWGNLTLQVSADTVVGVLVRTCWTVGAAAAPPAVNGSYLQDCVAVVQLDGSGGLAPGQFTAAGQRFVPGDGVNFGITTLALTGTTGYYVRPSGGTLQFTNQTATTANLLLEATLVN